MADVTFNAVNKLITVTTAPVNGFVTVDVKADLYSAAKDDWLSDATLNRFTFPFTSDGGGNTAPTFFLRNDLGWRIYPYDQDHELILTGNLRKTDEALAIYQPRATRTILITLESSAVAVLASGAATNTALQNTRDVVIDAIAEHIPVPRS